MFAILKGCYCNGNTTSNQTNTVNVRLAMICFYVASTVYLEVVFVFFTHRLLPFDKLVTFAVRQNRDIIIITIRDIT